MGKKFKKYLKNDNEIERKIQVKKSNQNKKE